MLLFGPPVNFSRSVTKRLKKKMHMTFGKPGTASTVFYRKWITSWHIAARRWRKNRRWSGSVGGKGLNERAELKKRCLPIQQQHITHKVLAARFEGIKSNEIEEGDAPNHVLNVTHVGVHGSKQYTSLSGTARFAHLTFQGSFPSQWHICLSLSASNSPKISRKGKEGEWEVFAHIHAATHSQ